MINLDSYWMHRDSRYRLEWTSIIQVNGRRLVAAVNKLLEMAEQDGIVRDEVASGWRPQACNDATANAAKCSKHLTGRACDIRDAGRELAQWCLLNLDKLAACGLYMEDPRWTYSENGLHWVHFQDEPPKSGKRVFIPNNDKPKGPPLLGQKTTIPNTVRV